MAFDNELTAPVIHLNGSGANSLIEGYAECITALNECAAIIRRHSPHGRDYYPMGNDVINHARTAWDERIEPMLSFARELEILIEEIDNR